MWLNHFDAIVLCGNLLLGNLCLLMPIFCFTLQSSINRGCSLYSVREQSCQLASQRWLEVNDLGRLVNRYGRRQWHPTPVLLPGKSHGRKSLVGCSPWGRSESGTTERLHFHISLSCIGGGHGNPLQCSCLENPRDCGAWWAAVH